jgi:HEAT repeat protein
MLAVTLVFGGQMALRLWWRQFLEEHEAFGPSVKPGLALLIVAGIAAMLTFANWAGHWNVSKPTPPVASVIALVVVGGLMLIAGWTPVIQRNVTRVGHLDGVIAGIGRWVGPPVYVLCGFLSALDFLLARPVAVAAGARVRSLLLRYLLLFAHIIASALLLVFWESPFALVGLAWAFLIAFGLARRWSWVEDDRERYRVVLDDRPGPRTQIRVGFDEDLRDEALTAFLLLLVIVLPLALMRANEAFTLFADAPGPSNWLLYVGSELLKAAPFVDWSEVYGINTSPAEPDTEAGKHAVFIMRALMDLLLIAAIFQSFTISARLGRQRLEFEDPSEPNELLDPFEERALFLRVGNQNDWREALAMPLYNETRLSVLIERRRQTPVTIAAARLAGLQLSEKALRELLSTGAAVRRLGPASQRRLDPRTPMSKREFWALLRTEAAEGLRRRREAMGAEAVNAQRFQRTIDALATTMRITDIDDELKQIGRRRTIEDLALRMTAPSPAIRKEATDRFQDEVRGDDMDSLMDLTGSLHRRVVVAAATAVGKVAAGASPAETPPYMEKARAKLCALATDSRADVAQAAVVSLGSVRGAVEGLLADVIQSGPPAVRQAAVDALGRLATVRARQELIDLLDTNRRGLAAAAAHALRRSPHESATEALLRAARSRLRDVAEAAIDALGAYRTEAVRLALQALAREGDEFAAPRALSALYSSGAQETASLLAREFLASESPPIRRQAIEIIIRGQDLTAAPALIALAEDVSAPEELRILAIEALERIGAEEAIEPLRRLRETPRRFARSLDASSRVVAPRRVRDAARDAAVQLRLRQRESKRSAA